MEQENEGKIGGRNYHNYTEQNEANSMASVNNNISKNLSSVIFQIPCNTLVNKCLWKPILSERRQTILSHEEE